MAGISINVLSNVRDAVRGVDDVADAVDEVADRLNDLTREGDRSVDRMESDFRDLSKTYDRTSDQLRDKFRDTYRSVGRAADDAADDASQSMRRMGDRAEEVSRDVRDEVRQNLGEGIANAARGDFESLADTIGDTFGGAVAGIGGLGFAAAGAAGALGIGALIAAFQLAEEQRKALEERAADLARAYIDAGTNVLDAMTIAARASDYLADPEKRKETEKLADVLGISMPEAARTLAGDLSSLNVANEIVKRNEEERLQLMQDSAGYLQGDLTRAEQDHLNRLLDQDRAVRDLNSANGMANQTFADQQQLLIDMVNNYDGVTKSVDEVGNAVYNLPDGTQIMIDAETGQATTDVSKFKGDVDGIAESHTTRLYVTADTSGIAAADNWLASIQRRAAQGITVQTRVGGGRVWE